jgi:hypothetical protein
MTCTGLAKDTVSLRLLVIGGRKVDSSPVVVKQPQQHYPPTMTSSHDQYRTTYLLVTLISMLAIESTLAFAPPQFRQPPATTTNTPLDQKTVREEDSVSSFLEQVMPKSFATAVLAASVWCAPAMLASVMVPTTTSTLATSLTPPPSSSSSLVMDATTTTRTVQQYHSALSFGSGTAFAREMASGSGSRVNKDPESLLRYGLPISNPEVRLV